MRVRLVMIGVPVCVTVLGCAGGHAADSKDSASGSAPPAAETIVDRPKSSVRAGPTIDSLGPPPGYIGRPDDSTKSLKGVTYTTAPGGMWEVRAGTHAQNLSHILYTPQDSASGNYTIQTEIDQLEGPAHPEAFGVIFGGKDLAGRSQKYGYFLVRVDGMYSIKARDGDSARTVVAFTPSPNVSKADAAGRAQYPITVQVAADSVRFLIDAKPVAAIARTAVPTTGIAGIRINHGLHLMVRPLVISR
jgi:hypothetical protein